MSATLLRTLAEIVGPAHCLAGADRAPYVVDGRTPCGVVLPGSVDEVARVVRAAAAAGVPVLPWGGATQMARGTPPPDGALPTTPCSRRPRGGGYTGGLHQQHERTGGPRTGKGSCLLAPSPYSLGESRRHLLVAQARQYTQPRRSYQGFQSLMKS